MQQPVVVGIDVGGTKVAVGAVTHDGEIAQMDRWPMDRSTQTSAENSIETALFDFMKGWTGAKPLALGFGLVGATDPATSSWVWAMNIPIKTPIDASARFGAPYDLPVAVDNDVHAATLAELRWGAGVGASDFVYLNIGTGIAAGMVVNGQLVRGAGNQAGEFGHTVTGVATDVLCPCGRHGCLEPIASGGGLLHRVGSLAGSYPQSPLVSASSAGTLTAHDIFEQADAGDPLAVRLTDDAIAALTIALANLINLLSPQLIVCGGGVWTDGWLLPRVEAAVGRLPIRNTRANFQGFVPSTLDPAHVGLLGAATLAWDLVTERH